jgi:hypothetical protein
MQQQSDFYQGPERRLRYRLTREDSELVWRSKIEWFRRFRDDCPDFTAGEMPSDSLSGSSSAADIWRIDAVTDPEAARRVRGDWDKQAAMTTRLLVLAALRRHRKKMLILSVCVGVGALILFIIGVRVHSEYCARGARLEIPRFHAEKTDKSSEVWGAHTYNECLQQQTACGRNCRNYDTASPEYMQCTSDCWDRFNRCAATSSR